MISFRRLYHVSSTVYSMKKLGMQLNKMISPKAKRQWHPTQIESDAMPSVKSLTKTKNVPGKRATRRSSMLNKMFMKNITDLMSTGTVSMDVVGRGIEVSKVKITPDLQKVLVFWVCKGDTSDEETEAMLRSIAGALRHELSTLRVMGEVPYIDFVKDHQEAKIVDLDRRLQLADYGEDYTPTDMGHLLRTEFTLNTKISAEMKAKIKHIEEQTPLVEEPLPEMTHNVYGLEHERILNRLLAARKKSRDAWSRMETTDDSGAPVISYRTSAVKPDESVGDQKKELAEFLQKRKILQNKIHKGMRMVDESWQQELNDKHPDDDNVHDDDYIDDYDDFENDYFEHRQEEIESQNKKI